MHSYLEALYQKFSNSTIYILGGGHSILHQDIRVLEGKNTICVNNSYELLRSPTAIFWGTNSAWIGKHYDNISKKTNSILLTADFISNKIDYNDVKIGILDSLMLNRMDGCGFSNNINTVCGNNSGCNALNLAINMHPKKIVLLGFDMNISVDKKTHYHKGNGYDPKTMQKVYTEQFIPSFINLKNGMVDMNIDISIINTSLDSAITVFEKDDLINHLDD